MFNTPILSFPHLLLCITILLAAVYLVQRNLWKKLAATEQQFKDNDETVPVWIGWGRSTIIAVTIIILCDIAWVLITHP